MINKVSLIGLVDSPYTWGVVGFLVGIILGVTTLSVWLVAIGLGIFLIYLGIHGQAHNQTEGRLFAAGPLYMMSWVLGFIINALIF